MLNSIQSILTIRKIILHKITFSLNSNKLINLIQVYIFYIIMYIVYNVYNKKKIENM